MGATQVFEAERVPHPVERIRGMDDLALLYEQERPAMVRLAHLLTGSLPRAEELVQDAFVSVFEHRKKIDRPGAYLRTVVINNCNGTLRRQSVERTKLSIVRSEARADKPLLLPELDETWKALALVSQKERTALVLRYYEDLPLAEIAEVMGEREGTVKSLIHRGLAKLRKGMSA